MLKVMNKKIIRISISLVIACIATNIVILLSCFAILPFTSKNQMFDIIVCFILLIVAIIIGLISFIKMNHVLKNILSL